MAGKAQHRDDVRLTKKTARAVAMQEFGTAKGLERDTTVPGGGYLLRLGGLCVRIAPKLFEGAAYIVISAELARGTGESVRYFDPETLRERPDVQRRFAEALRAELFREWVCTNGPEVCCDRVERVWRAEGKEADGGYHDGVDD